MEQATLTEFYSAKKRPIEGIHPAKRRKVVQTESVRVTRQKTRRADTKIATRRTKTRVSSRSVEVSPSEKPSEANTNSAALDAFLCAEMKQSPKEPERVDDEVTSIDDDHDSVGISFKKTTSQRRRKTVHKEQETAKPDKNNVEEAGQDKTAQKVRKSTRRSKKATVYSNEIKSSTTTHTESDVDTESIGKEQEVKTNPKASIMVKAKSPVKTASSSGLKINPWISDQANKVLLSRGQAALLLSQQKSAASKDVISSKTKSQRPKEATKNALSKTKAQDGLEKARELIKKMRSLDSDASKSKVTSTNDASERLHKLAKRQSSDGASANSSAR